MDMNVRTCPGCGRLIPGDEVTCEFCGEELPIADRRPDMLKYTGLYRKLAGDLLRACWEGAEGKNVMISPLSILLLLCMAADGTKGAAREEILEVLGHPEAGDILGWFQSKIARDPSFSSANAVCVRQDMAAGLREEYRKRLRKVYNGEIFASADMARDVTEWIRKNTRGMIRDAAPESLNSMLLCLLNAVAFEGNWERPYYDWEIGEREFANADGTKSRVQMLFGEERGFIRSQGFTGFIKDYEGDQFRYMALLPEREGKKALDSAIRRLDLNRLDRPIAGITVNTGMPEHKFDFSREMIPVFRKMGIRKMFDGDADFSAIGSFPMQAESIRHRTFIDVDRAGTRAAAVSDFAMPNCYDPEKQFREVYLNRPFVFAIYCNAIPIFVGVVSSLEDCSSGNEEKEQGGLDR